MKLRVARRVLVVISMRILTLTMISTLVMVGNAEAGFQSNGIQGNGIQGNGIQGNGIQGNGIQGNGIQGNGIVTNGIQGNGIQGNGIQGNGIQGNGVSYSGVSIVGTQISYIGQSTSVYPYSCAHREDVSGTALDNCSACSMTVANVDSYCRTNYWDSICVAEAKSMCNLGAATVLTASFTNGTTARMRIDSVQQGASSVWNGSVYTNMSDVFYNRVSWVLDHAPNVTGARLLAGANSCTNQVCNVGGAGYSADAYCCNNSWDSLCVAEANAQCGPSTSTTAPSSTQGDSVCGSTGSGTSATPIQAVFLAGTWDQRWGVAEGGTKTASSSMFTIACRGIGAYAKCLDMGYKPFVSARHDQQHQACVRMVRADYCGDGSSFTRDGTPINVEDYFVITNDADIQTVVSNPSDMYFDGAWTTNGAYYLGMRQSRSWTPNAYNGQALADYTTAHAHCGYYYTEWVNGNWFATHQTQQASYGILLTNTGAP